MIMMTRRWIKTVALAGVGGEGVAAGGVMISV